MAGCLGNRPRPWAPGRRGRAGGLALAAPKPLALSLRSKNRALQVRGCCLSLPPRREDTQSRTPPICSHQLGIWMTCKMLVVSLLRFKGSCVTAAEPGQDWWTELLRSYSNKAICWYSTMRELKTLKQPSPRHTPSWVPAQCLGNAAGAWRGEWVGSRQVVDKAAALKGADSGVLWYSSESSAFPLKSCKLHHQFHNLLCLCVYITALKVHFNCKIHPLFGNVKMCRESAWKTQGIWGSTGKSRSRRRLCGQLLHYLTYSYSFLKQNPLWPPKYERSYLLHCLIIYVLGVKWAPFSSLELPVSSIVLQSLMVHSFGSGKLHLHMQIMSKYPVLLMLSLIT